MNKQNDGNRKCKRVRVAKKKQKVAIIHLTQCVQRRLTPPYYSVAQYFCVFVLDSDTRSRDVSVNS